MIALRGWLAGVLVAYERVACDAVQAGAGVGRRGRDSWFFGTNNPGNEKGNFLFFAGGVPVMREIFADVAAKGYEGFVLS